MKVKSLKNFFLYDGTRIELDSEYEMKEDIAQDLIRGGFVVESSSTSKGKSKIEDKVDKEVEPKAPAKKPTKKSTKKKVEE